MIPLLNHPIIHPFLTSIPAFTGPEKNKTVVIHEFMSFMPFTGFPSVFWKFWRVFSVKHEKGSIGLRSVPQQCVDFFFLNLISVYLKAAEVQGMLFSLA